MLKRTLFLVNRTGIPVSRKHLYYRPIFGKKAKTHVTPANPVYPEMNIPFWFRLIRKWCASGGTGLTLPFIVAADARAREVTAKAEDVSRILTEMIAYESTQGSLILRFCPHRVAFVFGVFFYSNGSLAIDPALITEKTSVEKLLEQIAQHSEALVKAGDYSRFGLPPDWRPFQDVDVRFIDSAIAENA